MSAYWKAIAGFVGGFAVYLQSVIADGLARAEVGQAILAGLVAAAAVYLAPKNQETRRG